jgi:transcriptional regulator with XRE-family HTH domain
MNVELKIARLKAGLTQTELAQKVGSHQPMLSLIESGHIIPKIEKAQAIATILGIHIEVICPTENKFQKSTLK